MNADNDGNRIDQQLQVVRDLQERIRSVLLDDSLEQLEEMMGEKQARLAGLNLANLSGSRAHSVTTQLQEIRQEEASLEELVSNRLMLMKTQLRKASHADRALKGYVLGADRQRGLGSASRDIKG